MLERRTFEIFATAIVAGVALFCAAPVAAHRDHRTFAAGRPGTGAPSRTVTIKVSETADGKMAFEPARLDVAKGEQVRFAIVNEGRLRHEFMLDSKAHNAAHGAMMREDPAMEHDDPNGKTLAPGETASILWRFSKPGTFEFACLLPGHYEAGMHGTVVVAP